MRFPDAADKAFSDESTLFMTSGDRIHAYDLNVATGSALIWKNTIRWEKTIARGASGVR